jgi:hypothetical protein
MRTKTDKYPNGYANKIEYWNGELLKAIKHNTTDVVDKCVDKLRYFTNKQTEWEAGEMSTDKGDILKVWCESSYDFEDTEREGDEYLVIAVDMGSEGTKTIGTMDIELKEAADAFAEIVNAEKFALAK